MNVADRSKGTLAVLLGCAALTLVAPSCGGDDDNGTTTGGKGGTAGAGGKGGAANGGTTTAGGMTTAGGTAGGTPAAGGKAGASSGGSGGTTSGGTAGAPEGGAGAPQGGVAQGGAPEGGSPQGGAPQGGAPEGGMVSTGGAPEGGMVGTGGDMNVAGGGGEGGSGPVACVTTFPGELLYGFDNGAVGPWIAQINSGTPPPTAPVSVSATEGSMCPGALLTDITWGSYSAQVASVTYPFPRLDWTGKTKLHVWVKLAIVSATPADIAAINGYQVFVSSGATGFQAGGYKQFTDLAWHESVVDLTTGVTLNDISGFGALLDTQGTMPVGGPTVPPETLLLVDDVWLE